MRGRQEKTDIYDGGQGRLLSVVSTLPMSYSNIELQVHSNLEHYVGTAPTLFAWKANTLLLC